MDFTTIVPVLRRLVDYLRKDDAKALRALGSELGQQALVNNEPAYVQIAAASYSQSKFLEKAHITTSKGWPKFRLRIIEKAAAALKAAQEGKDGKLSSTLDALVYEAEETSTHLGRFQTSVVEKARIKIATDIYAHGASLGRAAELAGAPKKELSKYIGATRLSEKYETIGATERLTKAKTIFFAA